MFGMLVIYSCESGYVNASDPMTRTCQANGNFSGNPIICDKIACPTVPTIEHGHPSAASGFYQDMVAYQCDPG